MTTTMGTRYVIRYPGFGYVKGNPSRGVTPSLLSARLYPSVGAAKAALALCRRGYGEPTHMNVGPEIVAATVRVTVPE